MPGDGAAGEVGGGGPGIGPRDEESALAGGSEPGLEFGVGGVGDGQSVDLEGVGVDIGLEGVGGDAPDALVVLLQGQALAQSGDEDLGGLGGAKADGDFAIGGNLGGFDGRGAAPGGGGGRLGEGRGEGRYDDEGESEMHGGSLIAR